MSQPSRTQHVPSGIVDNSLLLERIGQQVLSGSDTDKARKILSNRKIWSSLAPEQALQWSRLAQICTDHVTALEVLDHIHALAPEFRDAWQEHIDLLILLGKSDSLARLKALAAQVAPQCVSLFADVHTWKQRSDKEESYQEVDAPFAHFKRQQELLELYARLFKGRSQCFARQWADRGDHSSGYVPVRRAMTEKDIRDHLKGVKTYGIYLLHEDSSVSVGVIDVDLVKSLRIPSLKASQKNAIRREKEYIFQRINETGRAKGLTCLPEFSGGKGYHFWYFFSEPLAASRVRNLLNGLIKALARDLSCFNLEVFPKQDRLAGKGLGNLVKLPLGIHRKTGKPSYFLPKVQGDVWEQLEVLRTIEPISPGACRTCEQDLSAPAVISLHPRYETWCTTYPELATLMTKCPALGQVMALCREGRPLSLKEEKVLLGTIGFLTRGRMLVHALFRDQPEYNSHLVDFKLSRLRGSPLGCKRIHALLECSLDFCRFEEAVPYAHPLLFCKKWLPKDMTKSEKIENLQDALCQLQQSLDTVRRFLPKPG